MRSMLHSKIHRATITGTRLDYEGSIAICPLLMKEADILPHEEVHVLNVNSGARFTTYAITGAKNQMELRGAAARLAVTGDIVIVLTYHLIDEKEAHLCNPRVVYVDENNNQIAQK